MTLGRALDNDVVIDDPRVSRHHAQLLAETCDADWLTRLYFFRFKNRIPLTGDHRDFTAIE